MTNFKIGDIIIGNDTNHYSITNRVTKCEVVELLDKRHHDGNDIRVKVLEGSYKGDKYEVESSCFDYCVKPKTKTCSICGATRKTSEMKESDIDGYTCKRCYQKRHRHCKKCGREIHINNSYDYNGEIYCKSCLSSILEDKGIRQYSYHGFNDWKLYKDEKEDTPSYYIGAEIETEPKGRDNKTAVFLAMTNINCVAMSDSSLHYGGVEVVTHPETMAYKEKHKKDYKKFFEILNKYDYGNDGGAGLHFHVTRPNDDVITRLFVILESFKDEIKKLSRRGDNFHWCEFISDNMSGHNKKKAQSTKFIKDKYLKNRHDRYSALNLNNTKTIEFRFFNGANNFQEFWSALQFINNLMKQATSKKRLNEIKWSDLIKGAELVEEAKRQGVFDIEKKVMDTTKIVERLEKLEKITKEKIAKIVEKYIEKSTKALQKMTFETNNHDEIKDLMKKSSDFTENIKQKYQILDNVYYFYRNIDDYDIDYVKRSDYIPKDLKEEVAKIVDDFEKEVR